MLDSTINRLQTQNEYVNPHAKVELTTLDGTAKAGMFAQRCEDDDEETIRDFLARECSTPAGEAETKAREFADHWNRGEYREAAIAMTGICSLAYYADIDLTQWAADDGQRILAESIITAADAREYLRETGIEPTPAQLEDIERRIRTWGESDQPEIIQNELICEAAVISAS